jgi:carnitine O-acetyltransferase
LAFDATGKVSLDHIYVAPDPRPYFATLRDLDYCIPQLAKPYFTKLIHEYRQATGVAVPTVVDVGCSYGVNAALLRGDASIDELYERYAGPGAGDLDRHALVARDRAFVRSRHDLLPARFVGLDRSAPALRYATAAGLLDGAVCADLEAADPVGDDHRVLAAADLVVSTGCIGYVTERTIRRVAEAPGGRRPWMAHFVLRMFPYDPVADSLGELGYETTAVEGLFRQRRFASPDEQAGVLDRLAGLGVDPRGVESDGWFYAQLFLSRPRDAAPAT